jgi:hypothetical protein
MLFPFHFIAAAFSGRDFHPELARALFERLGTTPLKTMPFRQIGTGVSPN